MADKETAAESQADDAAESQADEPAQSQAERADSISLDEAKKLRSEAAGLRKRLKDAESKAQAAEDAKKPEIDRLTAERDRLKVALDAIATKQRETAGREAIREAARKAGATEDRRDLVFRSVKGDLTFDDDGEPENADQLVGDLKTMFPDLFRGSPTKVDAAAGTKGKPKEDANSWLRRAAGRPG